jgi:hypothetical protein
MFMDQQSVIRFRHGIARNKLVSGYVVSWGKERKEGGQVRPGWRIG